MEEITEKKILLVSFANHIESQFDCLKMYFLKERLMEHSSIHLQEIENGKFHTKNLFTNFKIFINKILKKNIEEINLVYFHFINNCFSKSTIDFKLESERLNQLLKRSEMLKHELENSGKDLQSVGDVIYFF